jgi:hypothetical protein
VTWVGHSGGPVHFCAGFADPSTLCLKVSRETLKSALVFQKNLGIVFGLLTDRQKNQAILMLKPLIMNKL